MSESKDANVATVSDPKLAYNIIRTAFISGAALSALVTGLALLTGNKEAFTVGATLTGSSITGMLGFIAGRKV